MIGKGSINLKYCCSLLSYYPILLGWKWATVPTLFTFTVNQSHLMAKSRLVLIGLRIRKRCIGKMGMIKGYIIKEKR